MTCPQCHTAGSVQRVTASAGGCVEEPLLGGSRRVRPATFYACMACEWCDERADVGDCDTCGEIAILRDGHCQPCTVAGLEHGHAHGLHTDHDWDAADRAGLADCPSCAEACRIFDTTGHYHHGLESTQ